MARAVLADEFGIEADRSKAEEAVELVAREHPFNPVKNYLENLRGQDLPFVSDSEIAKCFGFDDGDDVSIGLLRVHLRACVKRGLQPGSKMDSLLIIQGEQGHFKSTSIEALSPDADWYDESTRFAIDSRDALSSFNSAWIYEFSEVEKLLSTNDVATLKSWITRKVDKYCEKYEKISISHPRRCCLFGTTNSSAFLIDSTGARRFWVCENVKPANVNLVKKLRDAIWHQSLIELDEGLPFFLSNDDPLFKASQERAHHATVSDPWEDRLADHLKDAKADTFVSSNSLIITLGKKIENCHVGDYRRLSNTMKKLGWKKTRRRQAGSSHPADGYVYEGLKIQPEITTTNEDTEEYF
jgi:predicted P-loop ATPase